MSFYTNKYKIRLNHAGIDDKYLPVGTIFSINAIFFNQVELKPLKKVDGHDFICIEISALKFAFTETEYIATPE